MDLRYAPQPLSVADQSLLAMSATQTALERVDRLLREDPASPRWHEAQKHLTVALLLLGGKLGPTAESAMEATARIMPP